MLCYMLYNIGLFWSHEDLVNIINGFDVLYYRKFKGELNMDMLPIQLNIFESTKRQNHLFYNVCFIVLSC